MHKTVDIQKKELYNYANECGNGRSNGRRKIKLGV